MSLRPTTRFGSFYATALRFPVPYPASGSGYGATATITIARLYG